MRSPSGTKGTGQWICKRERTVNLAYDAYKEVVTYEVEVEVVESELLKGVIESLLDVLGLVGVVPELGSDPKVFTLGSGSLDTFTDLFL